MRKASIAIVSFLFYLWTIAHSYACSYEASLADQHTPLESLATHYGYSKLLFFVSVLIVAAAFIVKLLILHRFTNLRFMRLIAISLLLGMVAIFISLLLTLLLMAGVDKLRFDDTYLDMSVFFAISISCFFILKVMLELPVYKRNLDTAFGKKKLIFSNFVQSLSFGFFCFTAPMIFRFCGVPESVITFALEMVMRGLQTSGGTL